jgi:NAD(P)H-nitrite reductase large subunit
MKKTYLIIGSSAAGTAALSTLLRLDPTSEVICITKDLVMPYNTCLLPSYVANTKAIEDLTLALPADSRALPFLLNTEVVAVIPSEKMVYLANGQRIAYNALLLSTGTTPLVDSSVEEWCQHIRGIFTFHTLADAQAIKFYKELACVKHALVVGAGLTGLECADALASLGIQVSIIERKAYPLHQWLDRQGAQWFLERWGNHGIAWYCNDEIKECYSKNKSLVGVKLSSGKILQAQLLIFALGSRPDLALAHRADILSSQGIITDLYMQTSVKDIFAAGDCAIVNNIVTNEPILSSTWPDATIQGMIAAHNMVGDKREYKGVLTSFTSSLSGITITVCGTVTYNHSEIYPVLYNNDTTYCTFFIDQRRILKGFVMVSNGVGDSLDKGRLRKTITMHQPYVDKAYYVGY